LALSAILFACWCDACIAIRPFFHIMVSACITLLERPFLYVLRAPAWTHLLEYRRMLVNPQQQLYYLCRIQDLSALGHAIVEDLCLLLTQRVELGEQCQALWCLYKRELQGVEHKENRAC
jgi:hypothetical protein